MVFRKNLKKKFVLISVFNKKNLRYLCTNLKKYNYNFVSSGSTGKRIRKMGFKCKDISKVTKSKEMFDGRVKTINSLIYSSLLYKRENISHTKQFLSLKIPEIDIVVVNLYPFKSYLRKQNNDKLIEMIEISDHKWFLACQFHPEFTSNPRDGHPIFNSYIKSTIDK